jgi:hypothetical protein
MLRLFGSAVARSCRLEASRSEEEIPRKFRQQHDAEPVGAIEYQDGVNVGSIADSENKSSRDS